MILFMYNKNNYGVNAYELRRTSQSLTELTVHQALQQGIEAHKAGRMQEAELLYKSILKAQPKHPDANHNMGVLAAGAGKVMEAVPLFKTALEIKPTTAQFWLSYIDALIKLEKVTEARAMLAQAKSKGAKGDGFEKLEQRLQEAYLEPGEGSTKAAGSQPTYANILDSLTLDQAISLAKKKITEGHQEEAKDIYKDILKKMPKSRRAIDGLKTIEVGPVEKFVEVQDPPQDQLQALVNLYNQVQLQEALEQTEILVEQFPKSAILLNIQGAVLKSLGQLDLSIETYNKALEIKPDYVEAYYNIGVTLQEQVKLEDAIDYYNRALAIKPDYADAYNNVGNILQQQGRVEEAVFAYNKALSVQPHYAEIHNNIGIMLKERGNLAHAIEAFKRALAIKPRYAEALSNVGNAYKEQGKLQDAVRSFKEALAVQPDSTAIFNLALTLYQAHQYDEAIMYFRKDPSSKSRTYLLRCFYHLNRQSDFYAQLSDLINCGENNAVIGSYISRSQIRYGFEKSNPFCNEPLRYAMKIDLTELCDFEDIFVKGTNEILNESTVQHKQQALLIQGIQTSGNVFKQINSSKDKLEDILRTEIEKYRQKFQKSNEGFINDWPKEYSLREWIVRMKDGGAIKPHIHEEGWLSGSVYINVPPRTHEDSGNLVVCENDESNKHQHMKSINVTTGSLCLFPSSLMHYTIPFKATEDRIVLAFDMIPTHIH